MAVSRIMDSIPGGDSDLMELKAVGRPYRTVRFDVTHQEDLEAQHHHEPKHTDALQRNSWSSSTKRVLSSMPSRSIRSHQYQSQNTKMRRRGRPHSIVSICEQDVFRESEDFADDELLKKLQGLSVGETDGLLREMPLCVSEKRQIRALVVCWESGEPLSDNKALRCHQFQTCISKVLCGDWLGRLFQLRSLQLWQRKLKRIGARFGTGVLSYFIFLRRLLHYNILLLLINGLFLLLPQISNPPPPSKAEQSFPFWMLTGTGILTDSVMFYGHYASSISANHTTESTICPDNYNIPLAYIFTIGIGMFVTCVMLVYSMSKSFGKSFCIFKTTGNLALKVFCSWDFKVSTKRSVKLQSVNICIQLKEMLSELSCRKQKRNLSSSLGWLSGHLLVWSICLLCMAACMVAVYYLHPYIYQKLADSFQSLVDLKEAARLLTLPLVVSCISHLLPGFFDMLSRAEQYDSPDIHIYVSIVRNLLLKGCIFCVLCYYWLKKIGDKQTNQQSQCWETLVGQEVYRFVLMDLIFSVLYIIVSEFLWGLCITNFTLRRKKLEFDIAREVLELIYGQTLVWFGVLFSPLLPAMQIGKLFLLFYFKKTSLMMNFQPPRKHWRATQMSTLFISLLFFPSFIGALMCVIYTMWRITPSTDCGPFRNFRNMVFLAKTWIKDLQCFSPSMHWLRWAYIYVVDNPLFLFTLAFLFLAIIYIHMQVLDGQKVIIRKLQEQIDYEGEDKKFLIAKIQGLSEPNAQQ